ncbi:MAG TPA: hemerythrin domain-containing protein [Marmoricola sp.]|jgi:hemerythrin superfamily protein|nr:hemerythrin domain-containing protein [Marmoricola sp.]
MTESDAVTELELPTEGDVVDLILADHRKFEELLRALRDSSSDRDAVRQAFSTLHVAHAEAEEHKVYPTLRKKDAISEHEEEHGEHEHAEGHQALLNVLQAQNTDNEKFDELVEELAKVVNHHMSEEELTILNPAREEISDEVRQQLGSDFCAARNQLIEDDCGRYEKVAELVDQAQKQGLLEE